MKDPMRGVTMSDPMTGATKETYRIDTSVQQTTQPKLEATSKGELQ